MSGKHYLNVCPHTKDRATENVIVSVPQINFTRCRVTTFALTVGEGEVCIIKHHIARCLLLFKAEVNVTDPIPYKGVEIQQSYDITKGLVSRIGFSTPVRKPHVHVYIHEASEQLPH